MTQDELSAAARQAEPLIFTTAGNLPASSLRREVSWQFVNKPDGSLREIHCVEEWFRLEDGKSVKRGVFTYLNESAELGASLATPV